MKKFDCSNQVILKKPVQSDFREPPIGVLTAFRVCNFSDENVSVMLRVLCGFERILLCKTRREGIDLLNSSFNGHPMPNADAAFTIDAAKVTISKVSQTFFSYGFNRKTCRYFDNAEIQSLYLTQQLNQKSQVLEDFRQQHQAFETRQEQVKSKLATLNISINEKKSDKLSYSGEIRDLKNNLTRICDQRNDFEELRRQVVEELKQVNEKIDRLLNQQGHIAAKKSALGEAQSKLHEQLHIIDSEILTSEEKIDELNNKAHFILEELGKLEHSKKMKDTLLDKFVSQEGQYQEELSVVNARCVDSRIKAEDICSLHQVPVTSPRIATDALKKQLENILTKLGRQNINSEDIEILASSLDAARSRFESALSICRSWKQYMTHLLASLEHRTLRFSEFRKIICIESQLFFCYFMSHRGFNGKLLFDHSRRTLRLSVQISSDKKSDYLDGKDVKTLSGGEKSIATTCFLLALWNSMETPLRCLDEFDVFMDNVNRSTILKMLLNFAKSSALPSKNIHNSFQSTQYIFITPQVLSLDAQITTDNNVKILRMKDPERRFNE